MLVKGPQRKAYLISWCLMVNSHMDCSSDCIVHFASHLWFFNFPAEFSNPDPYHAWLEGWKRTRASVSPGNWEGFCCTMDCSYHFKCWFCVYIGCKFCQHIACRCLASSSARPSSAILLNSQAGYVITSHILLWDVITYPCLRYLLLPTKCSIEGIQLTLLAGIL